LLSIEEDVVRVRRVGAAALTVAAAVAAATLAAGGVGSAASGTAAKSAGAAAAPVSVAKAPRRSRSKSRATAAAGSARSLYLKVTGIPGEDIDPGYVGTIGVSEMSYSSSAIGGAKTSFADLEVKYHYDRSVPPLQTIENPGKVIPNVTLTETDANGNKYLQVILTNARVDSIEVADANGDSDAEATVKFSYEQIEQIYTNHSTYKTCWDLVNNIACTG
jgi:type VI protein secretion system component Hcp